MRVKFSNLVAIRKLAKKIEQFMVAIEVNDIDFLESALDGGFNVNITYNLNTPLTLAVKLENLEVVELLIKCGANVNCTNSNNLSPLYITCLAGCDFGDMARVLIRNGADVNFRDGGFYTPLHLSVIRKQNTIFEELLKNSKTNVNAQSATGITAIALATQKGNYDMVGKLIDRGANPDICDMRGITPMHVSCLTSLCYSAMFLDLDLSTPANPVFIDLLKISDQTIEERKKVMEGKLKIMKYLVLQAGRPKAQDLMVPLQICIIGRLPIDNDYYHTLYKTLIGNYLSHGLDPVGYVTGNKLHYMIERVKFLLQCGATPNIGSYEMSSPNIGVSLYHYVAYFGYTEVMKLMIKYSSLDGDYDINHVISYNGATPLHVACATGHDDIAKLLINAKANINVKMKTNETPLSFASRRNKSELVKVLLDRGAFIDLKIRKVNPLTIAKQNGFTETVKVLNKTECFIKAVKRNQVSLVKKYSQHGAPVNVRCEKAMSAIHIAASKNYSSMLTLLIDLKFEVNLVDEKDYTPLHYSAKLNSSECLKTLLSNGAIYNKRSSVTEKTPVDLASDDNRQFLELLEEMFFKTENRDYDVFPLLYQVEYSNNKDDLNAILNAINTNRYNLHALANLSAFEDLSLELYRLESEQF